MRLHLRAFTAMFASVVVASATPAQEPIRFARTPDISPDGKTIAFSYLGDIWTVEAIGGVARPVTMHEAHDINPVFSPDGKQIAFSSNRYGSYDVFVVPAVGGKPKRLTFDQRPDMVTGWTPDGKGSFSPRRVRPPSRRTRNASSCRSTAAPSGKLPLFEAKEAHFAPGGNAIAFVRGPGTWYRRGYRGSSNDDIWISNTDGTNAEAHHDLRRPGQLPDVQRRRAEALLRQRERQQARLREHRLSELSSGCRPRSASRSR